MNPSRLTYLIEKFEKRTATDEEIVELEDFYNLFEKKSGYTAYLDDTQKSAYKGLLFDRIQSEIHQEKSLLKLVRNKSLFRKLTVAASILVVLGTGLYLFYFNRDVSSIENVATVMQDSIGVKNKAVLTLANGQKISLTDAEIGILSTENGVSISKTAEGKLVYNGESQGLKQVSFNQIDIPKGEKYQIQLPDGTKVWLNAASSLRYPSVFNGKERLVELSGEAYFEVAKDKVKPFRVRTVYQTIEVLGTHFNVNSYADENWAKTTLLEGSVKVSRNGNQVILKPGEQAFTESKTTNIQTSKADLEEILAWRNGYFQFGDADIKYIMKNLSRWYDIEVEYEDNITKQKFGGAFPQSASLAELLKYLESYGDVHFKVQGRRVIVMK